MNKLFVVILFAAVFSSTSSMDVKCIDKNSDGHEKSRCTVEAINRTPWSTPTDKTAPSPNSLNVDWYTKVTDDGKRVILLDITWTQKAHQIIRHVDAYYMEIKSVMMLGPGLKRKFNFNLRDIKMKKNNMVTFNYDSYGSRRYDRIDPSYTDESYIVAIHALPLYQPDEPNGVVTAFVRIPGCGTGNREIDITDVCKDYIEQTNKRNEQVKKYVNDDSGEYNDSWYDNSINIHEE